MDKGRSTVEVLLTNEAERALVDAARDARPVSGLTHNYYRYPARFSPTFARAAIEAFTLPGDLVLDPYVGGGTTLVEAISRGRQAIGVDISELADFISTVKTTIFTAAELGTLAEWAAGVGGAINIRHSSPHFPEYEERGYFKHMDSASRWRLLRAVEQALGAAIELSDPRLESFARCAILRTAQWALDSRKKLPSISEFRKALFENVSEMAAGAEALRVATSAYETAPSAHIINASTAKLSAGGYLAGRAAPRLVLTSPPYPGMHVLYHRWQVDGRKESALPFWIANKLDGSGASYYTMGDRKYPGLRTYFDNLRATTAAIVDACAADTVVVQMVAFSEPSWQLPRYLEVMADVGLTEVKLETLAGERDGRLWRTVPNRRWYANLRGATAGSEEVVLLHRLSPSTRPPRQGRSYPASPPPNHPSLESLE